MGYEFALNSDLDEYLTTEKEEKGRYLLTGV